MLKIFAMKLLFVFIFIFISNYSFSQPKDVLKFDCNASLTEKGNSKEDAVEGYSLLIVDFGKMKIETYPDSVVLNFIGTIEQRISKGLLIMDFNCRDRYNNSCKAHLIYSIKDDKAVAMKLEWDNWSILYFIEKQTQFPIKK